MKKDPVLDALRRASKGLLFPSESEATLQPFVWKDSAALDAKRVVELAKAEPDTAVETTTLDDLFATVPSEDRARFDALRKTLEAQVKDIQVYKLGDEAEKTVYIVGKTADGRWAGLKTQVVET
jgi:hypothetical protein